MTETLIDPSKLKALEGLTLKQGSHSASAREYCFNEAAAYLAGERHSDAPTCVSPVLRRFTMRLNDRWSDEQRQTLKPYLVRVIGTAGDGLDERREQIAMEWTTRRLLGPWLRLAGLGAEADALESADPADKVRSRELIRAARDAAWSARSRSRSSLRAVVKAKVIEELAKKSKKPTAAAAAAAAADAAADAVAAAAAAADAAAVAAGSVDWWDKPYSAAYKAARAYYDAHPLPISQQIAELAAEQRGAALELLDLLIVAAPAEVSA